MLSPGSSKATCVANSLVTISKVIKCTLAKAERILYSSKDIVESSSMNPHIKMIQARSIFQRKLFEVRILLSRLLVVLRWSKTMHLTKNDSIVDNLFSGPEIYIQSTFYEINQYISKARLKSFPNLNSNMNSNSKIALSNTLNNQFDLQISKRDPILNQKNYQQQIFNLFMNGIPKRIRDFSNNGRNLIFVAPGEYSFILKSDKRGILHLSSFKINVPKDFHFSEEIIILLTKLLISSLSQLNTALPRIDRVLHSFYLYCAFAKIVKSICDSHENYPIYCEGSSFPPSINLIFPPLYGPLSSFRLGIQMGRLIVSSVGTVYLPPISEEEYLRPLGTFNRLNQTKEINDANIYNNTKSYSTKNKQITFVLKNDFWPPDLLLSFLRDIVLYTKFIKVWNTTIHVIRSVSFSYFESRVVYNSKMTTFNRIEITLKKNVILTISIDAWTGAILVSFNDQSNIGLPSMTFSCIEPEEISSIMSKVLTNFTVHKAVEAVYGVKVPSNAFLKNPKLYSRCFSFAPDFSLYFHADSGHPHVCIFDNDCNQYTSPDIVEMISSTPIKAWSRLEQTLQSSKALIFLLQAQKSLQELGIQSVRTGLMLDIMLPMCRSCSLVVNKDGWRLLYSHFNTFGRVRVPEIQASITAKSGSISKVLSDSDIDDKAISNAVADYSSNQIELSTVIRGYSNLARSAQIVAQIIINLHQSRSNFFNIIMLARRTMAIEQPYLSSSNEMLLRFQNDGKNTLMLSFGQRMKYCGACHEISFFEMNPTSIPQFQVRFLSLTPIQWMIDSAIPNSNDSFALSSFINHSAIPFLKFSEVFSSDLIKKNVFSSLDHSFESKSKSNDFVIMPLQNTLHLFMIYKNSYTLAFHLKPFHSFYVLVPSSYPSVFLIIPLNNVKKDLSFAQGRKYFEVPMSNLEKLRDSIVTFVDFYEEVVNLDFKYRGFLKTMEQVNFFYDSFQIVKMYILISGKDFKLHVNSNEVTEIIGKITENAGLDPFLLRGLFNVTKLVSNPPFCQGFDSQQIQLIPHKYMLYIFSLVRFLMERINLPLSAVSKMLNTFHPDSDSFMSSLIMNVEKSRSERFFLMFEKNPNNFSELKTKFMMNGMQPTEINSFDELLILINQQNAYLSVF